MSEREDLGWDVSIHGRMADHATNDDAVTTRVWVTVK